MNRRFKGCGRVRAGRKGFAVVLAALSVGAPPAAFPSRIRLTVDRTNYVAGEAPAYAVSGAPPNARILWSSWRYAAGRPASTGELDSDYGQETDAEGSWTGRGEAWEPRHAGFWAKQVKIGEAAAKVYFNVSVDSSSLAAPHPSDPRRALGAAHVGGKYRLTPEPFLLEGAEWIRGLGADCIFVYLTPRYRTADYPHTDFGGGAVRSLAALAGTAPYRRLFRMPFSTFVITAYTFSNWAWISRPRRGAFTGAAAETREMKDLAARLLADYKGSGKTFILKDWEGDWQMNQAPNYDPDYIPGAAQTRAWTAFHRARYEGLARARSQAAGTTDVQVKYAIEFNFSRHPQEDRPSVLKSVVAEAPSDFVAYSSWQSFGGVPTARLRRRILDDVAFLRNYPGMAGRPLIISEYGSKESADADSGARVRTMARAFLDAGVPYAFYWEVIDNTCAPGGPPAPGSCRGLWLVRPDGSKAPAWEALRGLIERR